MEAMPRMEWDGKLAYKLYNHSNEHPFKPVRSNSIGKDGLLFHSTDPIPPQSVLVLKLYRNHDYVPVRVLVKVHRCDMNEVDEIFEVECVFHDLNLEQQAVVHELVEELEFIRRVHNKVKDTMHKNGMNQPQENNGNA